MKLLAICILRRDPAPCKHLAAEYNVSSFGFFQRSSVQEFLGFFASTLAEKTKVGIRQAVEQDMYKGYVYTNMQGLSGVIITDLEYPQRTAFIVINKVLEEFAAHHPRTAWSDDKPFRLQFPALREYLFKYQDPEKADTMSKVKRELNETKVVLYKTIESLFERGEKLDDLVAKSEMLSVRSKTFYQAARRTNACSCSIQ